MVEHHSDDYKLSAVKYYLKTKNYDKTCQIFGCSHRSLKRWFERYEKNKTVSNKKRKSGSYKIKQKHVDYALLIVKKYPDLFLHQIHKILKAKFDDYTTTWQHLHNVLRDNNITRKRISHQHFPKTTRGVERNEIKEIKEFHKEIKKYDINDIIAIDETSIKGHMMTNYGQSPLGKRCKIKTNDNNIYKKYTFVSAITTKGTLGGTIYEKGGMDSNRFIAFLDKILNGVKNKLIVLDNGGMHKTEEVKNQIINSGNKYLYIISYKHYLNPCEEYFNQFKHYVKMEKPIKFDDIKKCIVETLKKIKTEHYKNYFLHAYDIEKLKKIKKVSNRKKTSKLYKK
jgi:transposase